MAARAKAVFLSIPLLSLMLVRTSGQTNSNQDQVKSCKAFVQRFYDWYVPKANDMSQTGPTWDLAMKYKGSVLSVQLTQLLRKSNAEQRRADDAGIDFDPILNSQDPGDRYEARVITIRAGRCFADVYSHYSEPRREDSPKPDVVAELTRRGGEWQFVNFHYPDAEYPASENMISIIENYLTASYNGR